MAYLLDSDWVIDLLADEPDAMALLSRLAPAGIGMSVITYMEAYQGTLREPDPAAAQAKLETLIASVPIFPLSPEVARRCAWLRETLRQGGKRVTGRALDLVIAATALERRLVLVTRNTRDYRDIPGLRLHPAS